MSRLTIPEVKCVEKEGNFGHFVAEPLEKGFGITLGNAMRRVLLAYLPGAAVASVKIDGIQHEFSPIPNVKEDTTEFLLNVKDIRLKSLSGNPSKLTLEAEGEGAIHAGDIKPSNDFEVVNHDLYLTTLDSPEAKLNVEFDVELGEGYQEAGTSDNLPIGVIPLDAIFTPVRKVNFTIEPIHAGQETSRQRLHLEVWTDGTITPEEAASNAASILIEQLSPFVDFMKAEEAQKEEEAPHLNIPEQIYNKPVEQLGLSVRTMNCLRRGGITTVGELISRGEANLMSLRNFGQKSKEEVEARLNELGLSLTPPPVEKGAEHEA